LYFDPIWEYFLQLLHILIATTQDPQPTTTANATASKKIMILTPSTPISVTTMSKPPKAEPIN
jgi:hypothetical protein